MKKHIPNIITLGNLTCGFLSIWASFSTSNLWLPSVFIFAGLFLDFFDGFFARTLKVDGELGKQLDSLADLVTFGIAPGVIAYNLALAIVYWGIADIPLLLFIPENWYLVSSKNVVTYLLENKNGYLLLGLSLLIGLMIPLLSAIRLGKFNISTNQTDQFIGLPTPANAVFVASLPLVLDGGFVGLIWESGFDLWLLLLGILITGFSLLLNANLPLIALKFKTFGWKGNEVRFIFLGLSVVTILLALLISNVFVAVPIIILLYLIISIINNITKRKNEVQSKH